MTAHLPVSVAIDALTERDEELAARVAALEATVSRRDAALRRLCGAIAAVQGWLPQDDVEAILLAALDASDPAPDDCQTLSWWGPVRVRGETGTPPPAPLPTGELPGAVADAIRALRADDSTFRAMGFEVAAAECLATADALAVWARTLPPALGDEAREAMLEAADWLESWQAALATGFPADVKNRRIAARLRSLAGDA